MEIVTPADHDLGPTCSVCEKPFTADAERITTLHETRGAVTLCRRCYEQAGNSVR